MYSKPAVTCGVIVAVLFAAVTLVMAAGQVHEQIPTANIVSVLGATTTFQSRDMDGRLVEVEVPLQDYSAIRTSSTTQTSLSGTAEQNGRTVSATIVSIDQLANSVTVRTQANQMLVLQMAASVLADIQVGDRVTLVVPR